MTEKKQSISAIREIFAAASETELPALYLEYEEDSRAGVQNLIQKYQKQEEALKKERERTEQMKIYEHKYEDLGWICGIDEVGRGPLAGPVVAGAVILPRDSKILYLNDSKQLTAKKRDELYDVIMREAVAVGIGYASPARIDEINILQATYEAMREAISKLSVKPDVLLNDAVKIPQVDIRQVPIIKGDAKSVSIAAASIVAKVTRDRLMEEYDKVLPGYGFASNKGYGSAEHIAALKEIGPSPIHRQSFIAISCKSTASKKERVSHLNQREVGARQESRAAEYLESLGYHILVRNFRCRFGEIDLIAKQDDTYIFIEVKYRTGRTAGDPTSAVDGKKQKKISKTADYYRMLHQIPMDVPCRFDVVAETPEEIRVYANAFYYQGSGW